MEASGAVEALSRAGFIAGKPFLIGRGAVCAHPTALIASTKLSQALFTMGFVGAFAGCLAGFIGLSYIPSREVMYLVMVPLGGAFTGMTFGFLSVIGFNQFARLQETAGTKKYLGAVHDGDVAVSVGTNSGDDSERASRILAEHGARHLTFRNADSEPATTTIENVFQLSKTA
jgi:hypothetical protein